MKKHILMASMCLALTVNSAFARDVQVVTVKNGKTVITQVKAAPSSNLINKDGFITPNSPSMKMPDADIRKRFGDRRTIEREKLYNDLSLTPEQKIRAMSLDAKNRIEASQYIKKIQIEARKLRDLKMKHASFITVFKQNLVLKKARKNADAYFKSSKKEFEAILNVDQKAKFELINAQKRKEIKNLKKGHKPCRSGEGRPIPQGQKMMIPPSQMKDSGAPDMMGPPPPPSEGK